MYVNNSDTVDGTGLSQPITSPAQRMPDPHKVVGPMNLEITDTAEKKRIIDTWRSVHPLSYPHSTLCLDCRKLSAQAPFDRPLKKGDSIQHESYWSAQPTERFDGLANLA